MTNARTYEPDCFWDGINCEELQCRKGRGLQRPSEISEYHKKKAAHTRRVMHCKPNHNSPTHRQLPAGSAMAGPKHPPLRESPCRTFSASNAYLIVSYSACRLAYIGLKTNVYVAPRHALSGTSFRATDKKHSPRAGVCLWFTRNTELFHDIYDRLTNKSETDRGII